MANLPPGDASAAVLKPSEPVPEAAVSVEGPNFDKPISLQQLLESYQRIGFQANSLAKAIDIVNKMRKWRLSDEPTEEDESEELRDSEVRANIRCDVFLGYTSNLISSGLREVILHLVKHKHVRALVTTAGGIEEDFIKCLGKTYLADFNLDGADLRRRGMNRIGNLIVPNDNYCKFEDWLTPILDTMLAEQKETGEVWTPSSFIRRLGKEINNEESVYYWAYKNDIPVFCPALTDGSLGDMLYFHSFRSPGLIVDIVRDIRSLNELARQSKKAGMIILGGGVCKHQIANAMLIVRVASLEPHSFSSSLLDSVMELTIRSTLTQDKNLMARILVLGQTKLSHGARSALVLNQSRCLRMPRSYSRCWLLPHLLRVLHKVCRAGTYCILYRFMNENENVHSLDIQYIQEHQPRSIPSCAARISARRCIGQSQSYGHLW